MLSGEDHNFDIRDANEYDDVGNLDVSSIMMYDSFAFAATNGGRTACTPADRGCRPVLTRKGTDQTWGAANSLSQGDIRAVRGLYPDFQQLIVVTRLAARTPIRRFADGVAGNRFCVEQGYRRMTAEASAPRDVGTVVATFDSSTGTWTGERAAVRVAVYTSITCGV